MDGVLLVDKPVGPTSHDVVARMRRVLGVQRVGHTGTLDPGASGVLPLVIGRATRLARFLSAGDKRYEAVIRLGSSTDTHDAWGSPIASVAPATDMPSRETIAAALDAFRGTFLQQPPAFSAKRIAGRRSYELARAGDAPLTRPDPVPVTVHRLEMTGFEDGCVSIALECSAGFYVRALAHELGERLGTGAHLRALRRTASAGFTLAGTIALADAERNRDAAIGAVVPLADVLPGLIAVVLTEEGVERVTHGRELGPGHLRLPVPVADAAGPIRLIGPQGELVGIGVPSKTPGLLHPSVVLV